MTTTGSLIDVRDVGHRLAGVNIEIPAEIAIAEVCDAIDALTEDLHIRTNILYEGTGHASQSQGDCPGDRALAQFYGRGLLPINSTARA
jgi:hypothetical protein